MPKAKITIPSEEIAEFCKKNHIRKLSLFGSVLRDDFSSDSDIDFLVEFETGKVSEILSGRKVDLRTPQDLSKYFRQEVLARAEVQYAA